MRRVGITGVSGFIGSHLYNELTFCGYQDEFFVVDSNKLNLLDKDSVEEFVHQCDVIVHLAGINRSENEVELFQKNILFTRNLIDALERSNLTPHIIFSSSIQEENSGTYGRAKKTARKEWEAWSLRTGASFNGLLIPNVFGPFSKPHYNTVIATFCHQLVNKERPVVLEDRQLPLVYVDTLVREIVALMSDVVETKKLEIKPDCTLLVSNVLERLQKFYHLYFENGEIPDILNKFDLDLFNTLRSFVKVENLTANYYKIHSDNRGMFVELLKAHSKSQFSFSTTRPNVIRGGHFHKRKVERFIVLRGTALIRLRKTDSLETTEFVLDDSSPSFVDIPIWYTHELKNVGREDLLMAFYINEHFDEYNSDTFNLKV